MIRRLIILLLIVGCVPNPYDLTVESYQEQSPRINLGMTKYEVSQILSKIHIFHFGVKVRSIGELSL